MIQPLLVLALLAVPAPQVTIESGVLEGVKQPGGEEAFLGIPFAEAPIGALRWKPPSPVKKWPGVRRATAIAPACSQRPSSWWPEMARRVQLNTSEDCLYLNVWRGSRLNGKPQPVMVWIHGGGNVEGAAEIPPLAPALVRKGVVFVSIAYRLGMFGYLVHPDLTAESTRRSSGNYGLLDQVAALQWVHRNIAAFGGDPARVTIFGESSGGENVCLLMASPLGAGLFARAILESGVCLDSLYPSRESAGKDGLRLSKSIQALRSQTTDKLLAMQGDFGPVVDGWVIPAQPVAIYKDARNVPVPVIAGSNAEETTVFGKSSPLAVENRWPKTVAGYRAWLSKEFGEYAPEAWKIYPASPGKIIESYLRASTDYEFGFGAYRMADVMARQGQPAWLYYFTYRGRGPFASLGAFHSEELMFVGDSYWKSWSASAADHKLAGIVSDYWVRFASTGDPGWQQYDPKSPLCQEIGKEPKPIPLPHREGYALFERILQARSARP